MVKEIVISNSSIGRDATLSSYGETEYVLDEVDWGSPSVSFDTFRVPGQIGSKELSTIVKDRNINIIGTVISKYEPETKLGMNWNEYYRQKEEDLNNNKEILNKIINPFYALTLIIGDYFIEGKPTSAIKYSTNYTENNEIMCKFTFEVQCFKPMFRKQTKSEIGKKNKSKLFKFPMKLEKDATKFGEFTASETVQVINNGDVEVGGIIRLKANGGIVKNPSVTSTETGKTVKVKMNLNEGETLIINTNLGERNIVLDYGDGTGESVVQNMTDESSMFNFLLGTNNIVCSGESGTTSFIEANFSIDEMMFNIREQ